MSLPPAWSPPPPRHLPLGLAMLVAVLLHGMVLLLTLHAFTPALPRPAEPLPILQIDLTPRREQQPPTRPDRVADANQTAEATQAPEPQPLAPLATAPATQAPPPSSAAPSPPKPRPAPAKSQVASKPEPAPPLPTPPQPATTSLAERSLQMSRLRSDILEQSLRDEIAARSTVLTANTAYGPEAAYLRAWVEKVERIGNLNFPDEARRKHLSGRLILEVVLDDQGRVVSMRVRHSSGETVLDTAAQDIVRLAAPFAPFPPELRMKYDQLTIVRTWVFDAGGGLNTR